jgi:hypothetical protein
MAGGLALVTHAPQRGGVDKLRRLVEHLGLRADDAPGPGAVAASLERGLRALGVSYQRNPRSWDGVQTIGVLSDLEALRAAIAWRRGHPDRRLLAGPNLVVLPSDAPNLMGAPEIDLVVVPSAWVRDHYADDMPALQGRIAVWPAGVDPHAWSPPPGRSRGRRALLYRKALHGQVDAIEAALTDALAALAASGFTCETLTYGDFSADEYRTALHRSDVLVFFSPSESQCLALFEAWAADVPTLIWDRSRLEYRGSVRHSSSAPYLTDQNGRAFVDSATLRTLLADWDGLAASLRPREWLLLHGTDSVSAAAYLELARCR